MAVAMRMLAKEAKNRPDAARALDLVRVSERRGSIRKIVSVAVPALILVACIALIGRRDAAPLAVVGPEPLTSNLGQEDSPDISPDGQAVVYTDQAEIFETARLMIKRTSQNSPVKLQDPALGEKLEKPVWSPDGRQILYLSGSASGNASLWIIGSDGHGKHKVKDLMSSGEHSALDWSPDGRTIAYPDLDQAGDRNTSIRIFDLATGQQKVITHPPPASGGDLDPKFSPDGGSIAFRRRSTGKRDDLLLVGSQGGATRQLTNGIQRFWGHAWTSDGKSLIVSRLTGGRAYALWHLNIDQPGALEPLFEGTDNLLMPAVRAGRVAWVSGTDANVIFRVPVAGGAPAFVTGSTGLDSNPSIAPDGRIAFMSRRSGNEEIWIAEPDGSNPVRVTNLGGTIGNVEWSPDGRRLLFDSESMAAAMLMECEPGKAQCAQPRRVTPAGMTSFFATWSRDGSSIYLTAQSEKSQIFRISASGGNAIQVTHGESSLASKPSPDGKWLYFLRPEAIWRTPLDGGAYREELVVGSPHRLRIGDYTLAGDEVIFWDRSDLKNASAIRAFHTRTKRIRTISNARFCYSPAVSRDGRTLFYAGTDRQRGHIIIMMAKLSR